MSNSNRRPPTMIRVPGLPYLRVLPSPSRRRGPGAPTRKELRELELAQAICSCAQKPEFLAALEAREITAEFVAALAADVQALLEAGAASPVPRADEKSDADQEPSLREKLLERMREAQLAAKVIAFPANLAAAHRLASPPRRGAKLVTLEHPANVIPFPLAERSVQGVTRDVQPLETGLMVYLNWGTRRTSASGRAKAERAHRAARLSSIQARRERIQSAADAAWPFQARANARTRREFRLPLSGPFQPGGGL